MLAPDKFAPVEGGLIESVALVDQLTRRNVGRYVGTTLPGHLLHVVVEGEVFQEISGRHYRLTPGTAVWYHEDETVFGQILQVPWTFYTASFRARRLAPPCVSSGGGNAADAPRETAPLELCPRTCPLFSALADGYRLACGLWPRSRTVTRLPAAFWNYPP